MTSFSLHSSPRPENHLSSSRTLVAATGRYPDAPNPPDNKKGPPFGEPFQTAQQSGFCLAGSRSEWMRWSPICHLSGHLYATCDCHNSRVTLHADQFSKGWSRMEIIITTLLIGFSLGAVWIFALFVGLCVQVKQWCHDWINDTPSSVEPNRVLEKVQAFVGASSFDRFTCVMVILNALVLWPISLVLAVPVIRAFRQRERLRIEKSLTGQSEPTRLSPDMSTSLVTPINSRSASNV